MATIVLSAVGAAVGSSIGGSVLGLSSVVIGRAVGAIAGRALDNKLMGVMGEGAEPVETGKLDRLRINGVSEGAPVGQVFGKYRTGGHVIWASPVSENRTITEEDSTGSGKGMFSQPSGQIVTEYSYSISLAVALCEGEISHIGRVWADGEEVKPASLNMRVYPGDETQLPDPAIEAAMGAGAAPAFRGTAYVVIENLNLTRFNNRIPVLNFEVFRPEQPDQTPGTARGTRAVALIPGTGEYALATQKIHFGGMPGTRKPANVSTPVGRSDFLVSLDALEGELPNCEAISLVVSWFGDDLRAAECRVRPLVDQKDADGIEMPWQVSGRTRDAISKVPYVDGKPVYGGTPSDKSVRQALNELKSRDKAVTFYPFILIEQAPDNTLPDPWTGGNGQPVFPWRGRITLSTAPGRAGSPDGTAAAATEVADFFGQAQPGDFNITPDTVEYAGPSEWSYRRFILHYAHLVKQVGGIEAFLIGSELRGLTQIRGPGGSFPVVDALRNLAADVRSIVGPSVKVSYAADWSEYFGYHPQDGSGDVYFHLDPLWADANIDFIGIDNYMPLSDWRDGDDHADAHWGSIYDLDYLKSNVAGGEGFDWYYATEAARDIQLRSPITDGAHDEPWVFRYKDIRSWWETPHFERIGGVRASGQTDWLPGSKPIWFTEIGCAAIDKGTNQPNKFVDPKSSESAAPRYSNGRRDDFIQTQYLRALREYWEDPANNPVDPQSGVRMVDMSRAHVWAWDARPYPWFPNRRGLWGDWPNYERGHWLNGRATMRTLESVVAEICHRSGVTAFDTTRLYGSLRGYFVSDVTDARAALQPLMTAFGFEAAERDGVVSFFTRTGKTDADLDRARLAVSEEIEGDLQFVRAPAADLAGRVRLSFAEEGGDYDSRATEAVFADEETHGVSSSEVPLVLTGAEANSIAERWLAQSRVSQDRARFALPPSDMACRAGDVVQLETGTGPARFRIDRVEQAGVQMVQAVRVEPGVFEPGEAGDRPPRMSSFTPSVPVTPLWLDLPLLTGDEVDYAPHLAVISDPWPGEVAIYSSATDNGYRLNRTFRRPALFGITETAMPKASPGLIDRGPALRVRMPRGSVSSSGVDAMLNGSNVAAIGLGGPDGWEVFQFSEAVLVDEGVYALSGRLRGQAGSDPFIPEVWEAGAMVVLLDKAVRQIGLPRLARGLERHYRIGPASEPLDDDAYVHEVVTTHGVGLRPYRPVHLASAWQGTDLSLSWIRRTRIDGDSWQGVEVPIGHGGEQYLVRVVHDSEVVREVMVTEPGWIYTAAMQSADEVTQPFKVDIAQVSQSFGPGPAARIEIG